MNEIEQEIQGNYLTEPRVKLADIEANIASEWFFTAHDGVCAAQGFKFKTGPKPESLELLTYCVLVLKSGFIVTGESICANPENHDAELGRKTARQNAINKIWPSMSQALKQQILASGKLNIDQFMIK